MWWDTNAVGTPFNGPSQISIFVLQREDHEGHYSHTTQMFCWWFNTSFASRDHSLAPPSASKVKTCWWNQYWFCNAFWFGKFPGKPRQLLWNPFVDRQTQYVEQALRLDTTPYFWQKDMEVHTLLQPSSHSTLQFDKSLNIFLTPSACTRLQDYFGSCCRRQCKLMLYLWSTERYLDVSFLWSCSCGSGGENDSHTNWCGWVV